MLEPLTLPGFTPPSKTVQRPATAPGAPCLYVDPLRRHGLNAGTTAQARRLSARNGGLWCHLMIEAGADLEDLHRFARKIGLRREWFQNHPVHPHYDLTPKRRAAAVRAGALDVDGEEQVRRCHRHPGGSVI